MPEPTEFALSCPLPIQDYPNVLLAHGGGGRLMHQLIDRLFRSAFPNPLPESHHDGAVIGLATLARNAVDSTPQANASAAPRLAFTTDSYVVRPLFFPGGDIGSLAVNGTVNDLAMCGARPLYLSCGFILEEGLPITDLWRVVQSMKSAAETAGVSIVTGDTKVVDRGKGDGIFINTAGIGILEHDRVIAPPQVRPGDAILVSGDIGRHGIALMAVREGLEFESTIESDCAPLAEAVLEMLSAGIEIHCLRDCTRGGLATTLVEIAQEGRARIHLDDRAIPVHEEVRGACEILGLDPLYVANEGRFVAIVPSNESDRALEILRRQPGGGEAAVLGAVTESGEGRVTLRSAIGATRIVDMLSGEQLPRIC
jgi:hydrogenase expression/formation protein HypE